MLKAAFAFFLVVAAARSAEAQQVVAPGDSVRWSETEAGYNRKGKGRVLTIEPVGLRILSQTDTVDLRYANLKHLQRYKKRPVSGVLAVAASMAAAGVLVAIAPRSETICDGTRCVESTLENSRIGNPVVFGVVGGLGGLGLGLFFQKVIPGPWQTVITR